MPSTFSLSKILNSRFWLTEKIQFPKLKIWAEFNILAFQNHEFKNLAAIKILAFQNSEFQTLAYLSILAFQILSS